MGATPRWTSKQTRSLHKDIKLVHTGKNLEIGIHISPFVFTVRVYFLLYQQSNVIGNSVQIEKEGFEQRHRHYVLQFVFVNFLSCAQILGKKLMRWQK